MTGHEIGRGERVVSLAEHLDLERRSAGADLDAVDPEAAQAIADGEEMAADERAEECGESGTWVRYRDGRVGPPIVTLCGSMRFWPLMVAVAASETADGAIVLAPFVIVPPERQQARPDARGIGEAVLKERLDALHRAKLDMSTAALVVTDRTGYWGASTAAEIAYAHRLGLPIRLRVVDRVTGAQYDHGPFTGPHPAPNSGAPAGPSLPVGGWVQ